MAIVSAQDFLKGGKATLIGSQHQQIVNPKPEQQPVGSFVNDIKDSVTSFPSRVGSAISDASADIQKGQTDTSIGQSLVDSTKGVVKAGLGTAGEAAQTLYSPVTAAAKETGLSDALAKFGQFVVDKTGIADNKMLQEFAMSHPNAEKYINDILAIAPAAKFGEGAGLTAEAPIATASKVAESVPKQTFTEGLSRKITSTFNPPTASQASALMKFKANPDTASYVPTTVADTINKYGLTGEDSTIGIKATRALNKLSPEIKTAIASVKEPVPAETMFAPLEKSVADVLEPGKKGALKAALSDLKNEYGIGQGAQWNSRSLTDWQKIKSELDDQAPQKVWKGQDISNEYGQLRHELADSIRQYTYNVLKEDGIKQKFLDSGNMQELQKRGILAMQSKSQLPTSISSVARTVLEPVANRVGRAIYLAGPKTKPVTNVGAEVADHFKTNVIAGLERDGDTELAAKIKAMDVSGVKNFQDLWNKVNETVGDVKDTGNPDIYNWLGTSKQLFDFKNAGDATHLYKAGNYLVYTKNALPSGMTLGKYLLLIGVSTDQSHQESSQ